MKLSVPVWAVLLFPVFLSAALPLRAPDVTAAEALLFSPLRTAYDLKLDACRQPLGLLRFAQVAPSMSVLDMAAGRGYTTQLMALAVAATGNVWAQIPEDWPSLEKRLSAHSQANIEVLQRQFEHPYPKDALALIPSPLSARTTTLPIRPWTEGVRCAGFPGAGHLSQRRHMPALWLRHKAAKTHEPQ